MLIFNAIWFAPSIGALVFSIRRPKQTRAFIGGLTGWGRRHGRTLVLILSTLVGAYFTIRGATDLLG
ncbi:MAG TPA: hypothetical protein VKA36_10770 [Solirubrobacterales bacterium]|nr:hypothetical protein [Solirubrobacterales bacterium]